MPNSAAAPLLSPRLAPWIAAGLLVFGVQVSLIASPNLWFTTPLQEKLLGVVLVLALLPVTARPIARWIDRCRNLRPRTRRIVTLLVMIAATGVLLDSARVQNRDRTLKYHDEFSYVLQARMLAGGRLWMPEHPLKDFFDSFQIIVEPKYSSMYFPGTAILLVPGIWFGWPPWLSEVMVCGVAVGLIYYVVARLTDDVWGLLAALMAVEIGLLHEMSLLVLSDAPVMLYGLAAIAAWLCWRETRGKPAAWWAIATGFFLGLAAITRPLDALCYGIPIAVAMALAVRANPHAKKLARIVALGALGLAGAAPPLAMQITFNKGVTGSFFRTPFDMYGDRDYPQTSIGFHSFDPTLYPKSVVPEKHARPSQHTWKFVKAHTPLNALHQWLDFGLVKKNEHPGRIQWIASETTADPFILILVPLGIFSLRGRQWVVGAILLLFPILYYFYTFWFPQYAIPLIPAMALAAVVGARQIMRTWPRAAAFSATLLSLGIIVICITDLPELHLGRSDSFFKAPQLELMDAAADSIKTGRAVVLYRYEPGCNTEEEPVHNETACWPDDARVIRAEDLGPRDIELFRYYAKIQPDRVAYLYDRGDDSFTRLGRVDELAAKSGYNPSKPATRAGGTP